MFWQIWLAFRINLSFRSFLQFLFDTPNQTPLIFKINISKKYAVMWQDFIRQTVLLRSSSQPKARLSFSFFLHTWVLQLFFIWIILMKTDGSNREKLQKLDILRLNHETDGQLAHFAFDVLTSDEQYYSNQTNKKYVMIWRVFSVLVKNPSFSKIWFLRLREQLSLLSFSRLRRSVIYSMFMKFKALWNGKYDILHPKKSSWRQKMVFNKLA